MSTAELKDIVDKATPEERLFLEAYLAHLRRVNDPENAAALERRMHEMDQGKKISLDQAKRLHEALAGEGL